MYTKNTKETIYEQYNSKQKRFRECVIDKTNEFIVGEDGIIFRKMKSGFWKEIENKPNHKKGYNVILINKKQYSRGKVVLHAFQELRLDDKYLNIYHLNKNKLDCSLTNLSATIDK